MSTLPSTKPLAGPSVLLVDDNHDGLIVRKALLEELGYPIQIAHSGKEALEMFEAGSFAVVVTDYRMPLMNGTELIAAIRSQAPEVGLILLSGFVEPLGLTEQNTGADAVIAKSFNEATHLVRWVKRLINRTAQRKPAGSQRGAGRTRAQVR